MTKEFADVAQLVEQLIRNQQVNGSSPFVGSIKLATYRLVYRRLVYRWCTTDLFLQNAHRLLRHTRRSFDVEASGSTHVLMPQDALNGGVFDSQLLEVRRETE
jgi:hypothetical protein